MAKKTGKADLPKSEKSLQKSQENIYEFVKAPNEAPTPDDKLRDLERKAEQVKDFAKFLDMRQEEINKRCESLDERENKLLLREQELEMEALKRQDEQTNAIYDELQKIRVKELNKLTDEIKILRQTAQEEISQQYAASDKEFCLRKIRLDEKQEELDKRSKSLDEMESKLLRREQNLEMEALQRQNEQMNSMCKELQKIRVKEMNNLTDEMEALRQTAEAEIARRYADLDKEFNLRRIALDEELDQRRAILSEELKQRNAAFEKDLAKKQATADEELNKKREELDAVEKNLIDEKSKLEHERKVFEFDKIRLKKFDETLQNLQVNIDGEIETAINDRYKILEAKLAMAQEQEKNLLAMLTERDRELAIFQNFQAIYGNSPEILVKKMNELHERNSALNEELGRRPGEELQSDYLRLESDCKRLQQERDVINEQLTVMQEQIVEVQTLRNENTILRTARENLKGLWNDAQDTITTLQARIDRLTATEAKPEDWQRRAASLHEPYLTEPFNAPPTSCEDTEQVDEIAWLNQMEMLLNEYGITFPRRILYAFHTSFKIANWSTLTVLAGVSGTGKSELPRLYSAFGGFNFITVPVQPNWDSQESMLGFFNSIDNKFDAQPVLRFLVECTENYDNNMAIVLLDEMNLAHVEHYFADFLSKLETRRSLPESNVPEIYVNLGAGFKPYGLPLKRNVLWCGTMNQDETTKSLSDKVLDRGIIINFPRPRELKSREGAKNLKSFLRNQNCEPLPMSKQLWSSWQAKQIPFVGEQRKELDRYRHMLEEMNEYLSHAGRAIGHRVWQSIEHYVINYPTVRAALSEAGTELTADLRTAIHTAVEDQIVQKVMPKLRGIDTRGKSYEKCLAPIKGSLHDTAFNLEEDFDRACEMGYGQFIWSSAEYITAQENG